MDDIFREHPGPYDEILLIRRRSHACKIGDDIAFTQRRCGMALLFKRGAHALHAGGKIFFFRRFHRVGPHQHVAVHRRNDASALGMDRLGGGSSHAGINGAYHALRLFVQDGICSLARMDGEKMILRHLRYVLTKPPPH